MGIAETTVNEPELAERSTPRFELDHKSVSALAEYAIWPPTYEGLADGAGAAQSADHVAP